MNELPTLEELCPICKGRGGYADIEDDNGWAACGKCNGSGYVPTAIGVQILELVRHNSRLNVTAELRVCDRVAS